MSNVVYLVSLKTLKDYYIFDDNVDDKYILSNIQKGQRFIINGILGNDKYQELLTQVDVGSVTAVNQVLLDDYIEQILSYYILSEIVYTTAYKIKNVGIENANMDRFNELVKISQKYLKDSEQYQQLLKEYLCENSIITDNEGKKDVLKTGLYLGGTTSKLKKKYYYDDRDDCCD